MAFDCLKAQPAPTFRGNRAYTFFKIGIDHYNVLYKYAGLRPNIQGSGSWLTLVKELGHN